MSKTFEGVAALRGVSFNVHEGELFGLLGPNGAGKSTIINILSGLARADSGSVRIGGIECTKNPKAAQNLIGVVPDESNLYPELSGFENLCFCAALFGMRSYERRVRARELLDRFGLAAAAHRKFATYSKGMRRKLTIAAGIVHRPSILFLDEPTSGIDVLGARQIRQLIAELHSMGTTVFLTSHYIEEAERLCQRVAFLVSGQIVRIDTVADLLTLAEGENVVELSVSNVTLDLCARLASSFPQLECQTMEDDRIRVESVAPVRVGKLARFLDEQGVEMLEARRLRYSLEDIFVWVTGVATEAMRKEKEERRKAEDGA